MYEAVEWWPSSLATAFCYYPPPSLFFSLVFTIFTEGQHRNREQGEKKKLLAITFSPGDSGRGELSREGGGMWRRDAVRGDISAISNRFAVSRKGRKNSRASN